MEQDVRIKLAGDVQVMKVSRLRGQVTLRMEDGTVVKLREGDTLNVSWTFDWDFDSQRGRGAAR